MKTLARSVILVVAAVLPSLATAAEKIVSANFHKGTNNTVTGSYGAELLGAVAANWNNYFNTGSGTNLLDDDGVASTVDFTTSGFFQFTSLYPDNLDYSGNGRFNLTPLKAGPPTTGAGDPLVVNLNELNASFPQGYKVAVFLTGRPDNAAARITDGTTTYYFRGPVPLQSNVIANGDFETGTGTGDLLTYTQTPGWYNAGTGVNQEEPLRRNSGVYGGTYSGELAESDNRLPSQETAHVIAGGNTFVARCAWRDGTGWNALDKIKIRLFYTSDDTLTGTPTDITSFTDSKTVNGTWKIFNSPPVTVVAGAVGKKLFVQLDTIDGNVDTSGFALIDDLSIGVYPAAPSNQRLSTDTDSGDGIAPANLVVFGSDAAPLSSDSLSLTMTALSEGIASIGGLQVISANPAGRTPLLSCNLFATPASVEVIEPNSTWGLGTEGSPVNSTNWNNLRYTVDDGPSGVPLLFSNGAPSTVTAIPTDPDNDGKWDGTWGAEAGFSATWNNTPMRAGRTVYTVGSTVQYDLNNLMANFPFGYRLVVYLTGFGTNNLASISAGPTTYYFEVGAATLPPRRSTLTVAPAEVDVVGTDNVPDAEYVVFGSASTPLLQNSLTLTLTNLNGGGVAIGGFQIVGHELDVEISSLVGASLNLTVGNVPPGLALEVLGSGDLTGFLPLSPPLTFDSTTPQPLVIPVNPATQPKRFFSIAPAAAP